MPLAREQRRQLRELELHHRQEAQTLEERLVNQAGAEQSGRPERRKETIPLFERVRRAREAHEARERDDDGPERDRGFER